MALKIKILSTQFGLILLVSCAFSQIACNDRFEFDRPGAGGTAGETPAQAGMPTLGGRSDSVDSSAGSASSAGAACGSRPQCPTGLHCIEGQCYTCAIDADCAAPLPRCDPAEHRCIACLVAADCPVNFSCDPVANHCMPTCAEKEDCPTFAHGCDEHRAICYQCDEDRECATSPLGHLCAVDGSGCVQCHDDADCPGQHCEQLAGECVDCRGWRDCGSGSCDASGHCIPS